MKNVPAQDHRDKSVNITPMSLRVMEAEERRIGFVVEKSTTGEQLHQFKMLARYRRWRAEKRRPMRSCGHRRTPRSVRSVARKPTAKAGADPDEEPSQLSFATAKDKRGGL